MATVVPISSPPRQPMAEAPGESTSTRPGPARSLDLSTERRGTTRGPGSRRPATRTAMAFPDVVVGAPVTAMSTSFRAGTGQRLLTLNAERPGDQLGQHVAGVGDVRPGRPRRLLAARRETELAGRVRGGLYLLGEGRACAAKTHRRAGGDAFGATVAGPDARRQDPLDGRRAGWRAARTVRSGLRLRRALRRALVEESIRMRPAPPLGAMFLSLPGGSGRRRSSGHLQSRTSQTGRRGPRRDGSTSTPGRMATRCSPSPARQPERGSAPARRSPGTSTEDGRPDLIVGAWQYAGAAVAGGRATLYSGRRKGRQLATFTCRTPGDTFGFDDRRPGRRRRGRHGRPD